MAKFFHGESVLCVLLEERVSVSAYLEFQERLRHARRECFLFLEHPPTITYGINSKPENLLLSASELEARGIQLSAVPRGGDFTAHEEGQFVGYLHLDLRARSLALGKFLQVLEKALIETVETTWKLRLVGDRKAPGLYLPTGEKVLSLGVLAKAGFTSFGFALNWGNQLETFQMIRPCGLDAGRMRSLFPGNPPGIQERWKFLQTFQGFFFRELS